MPYTVLFSVTPDYMNKLSDEEPMGQITLLSDTNQGSTFTIHINEFESACNGFSAHGNEFFSNEQARF